MSKLPYPIPAHLLTDVEEALAKIPDRGNDVFRIRRLIGLVYAEGHAAGWMAAQVERNYDQHAPKSEDL